MSQDQNDSHWTKTSTKKVHHCIRTLIKTHHATRSIEPHDHSWPDAFGFTFEMIRLMHLLDDSAHLWCRPTLRLSKLAEMVSNVLTKYRSVLPLRPLHICHAYDWVLHQRNHSGQVTSWNGFENVRAGTMSGLQSAVTIPTPNNVPRDRAP